MRRPSRDGQGQCGRGTGLVSLLPLHPVPNSKRALSWKEVPYWSGCCCGCFFTGAGLDRE